MNRYKIIFSDIDGTLLDSKQDVLPKTKQTVLTLSSKGIPFILVSGRMPHSVLNVQKKIGFSAPFISYGGALVRDEKGQTLWDKPMNLQTAIALRKSIASFSSEKSLMVKPFLFKNSINCFLFIRTPRRLIFFIAIIIFDFYIRLFWKIFTKNFFPIFSTAITSTNY